MDAFVDHYKVLQVDPDADLDVIKAAYRRLARKYHPDVATGAEAAERMAVINAAWQVLRDPRQRAAHDAARRSKLGDVGGVSFGRRKNPGDSRVPAPQETSRNWTDGRSNVGGGYDQASMKDLSTHAGLPTGRPSGSVLNFGRYAGWSLGQIARQELEYLEWLERVPIGRQYRAEIDAILREAGRRRVVSEEREPERRGLFRRR